MSDLPNPDNPFDPRWQKMLDRENTLKQKPRDSRRDVHLHAAVTIMDRYGNRLVAGEVEKEIGQYAAVIEAKFIPVPEHHIRRAWNEIVENNISRMRVYGLVK